MTPGGLIGLKSIISLLACREKIEAYYGKAGFNYQLQRILPVIADILPLSLII